MNVRGGIPITVRFRPNPPMDGAFELPDGAILPIPAPDWDRALDLLKKINTLKDSSGRRISSLVVEDGFEPWWYAQDRLLRFYLVPLTQVLPVLEAVRGAEKIILDGAPPDLERVWKAVGGKSGFASLPPARASRSFKAVIGEGAMLAVTLASLAGFRLARRDTIFYIIDHVSPGLRNDFRFAPLYREFDREGFRYAEYAHTLLPRQALGNFFRRRRPVFFLESADAWARWAGLRIAAPAVKAPPAGGSLEDRALWALVPTMLEFCTLSVARQRILKRALKFQRARRAVIFDDNRHNHELIAACLSLGLPVLGFQHGVFNKFHAGLMAFGFSEARPHAFDRYGLWSDLFRKRLLRDSALFGPDRVFVSGPVRPPEEASVRGSGGRRPEHTAGSTGVIRVLVVSEPLARKHEVAPFLQALLRDPQFEVCLKLRPGESERSLEEYGLPVGRVRLMQTGTVYEALEKVDVAIGTYSTVLYEAALAMVPIVWMKTSRAYGVELGDEHLAGTADRPEELPGAIRKAAARTDADLRRIRELVWGKDIRNGSKSLVEELRRMESRG
ncbi:MAG: hypothetical protein ABSC61_03350 [Anaerolineales bacterium]